MNRVALVPSGGTKANRASSTAGATSQSLRTVVMLSRAGVSVSVTTYLRGHGRSPSAPRPGSRRPGGRTAGDRTDPVHDRLADHRGQGHVLHQQRIGVAVDQVGGREQDADRLAREVDHPLDGLRRGLGRVDLLGRVVQRQGLAVVVEALVHELAGARGEQPVRPLDGHGRREVVVDPVPRHVQLLDGALRGRAEPLQPVHEVGHPFQDLAAAGSTADAPSPAFAVAAAARVNAPRAKQAAAAHLLHVPISCLPPSVVSMRRR